MDWKNGISPLTWGQAGKNHDKASFEALQAAVGTRMSTKTMATGLRKSFWIDPSHRAADLYLLVELHFFDGDDRLARCECMAEPIHGVNQNHKSLFLSMEPARIQLELFRKKDGIMILHSVSTHNF